MVSVRRFTASHPSSSPRPQPPTPRHTPAPCLPRWSARDAWGHERSIYGAQPCGARKHSPARDACPQVARTSANHEARRRAPSAGMAIDEVHRRAGAKGFVTLHDVRASGVHPRTFYRHAGQIGWVSRYRGLWVGTGELDPRELIAAAVAASGGDVLVTGASALFLAGVLNRAPEQVELLVPAARRLASKDGICLHRTTTYEAVRYQHRGAVRAAAVPRAFADAAAHACVNQLCRDIATAVRLRCCSLARIQRELRVRQRFPGSGRLRRAHALLSGELVHSGGERLGRRLLRAEGFRPHSRPLAVEVRGRPIAEIDIPFPSILYGVEVDGPHHLLPDVAAADRARDRTLDRQGWVIDRFYWFELEERPAWFVTEVTRRLRQLGATRRT